MDDDELTCRLALSGFVLQSRPGRREWRLLSEGNLVRRNGAPNELGWEPITGNPAPSGKGQEAPTTHEPPAGPRWWIAYGEVVGPEVVVKLPDGRRPEVHTVGQVWAAEWVSAPVEATVTRAGELAGVLHFDRRMHF